MRCLKSSQFLTFLDTCGSCFEADLRHLETSSLQHPHCQPSSFLACPVQRQPHSMLRLERQTVAMELAAALHHSRDGGRETYVAYGHRRQPAQPSRGWRLTRRTKHCGDRRSLHRARPGILAESGPQRSDRSLRHSSRDGLPTLSLPVLGVGRVSARLLASLPHGCCVGGQKERGGGIFRFEFVPLFVCTRPSSKAGRRGSSFFSFPFVDFLRGEYLLAREEPRRLRL